MFPNYPYPRIRLWIVQPHAGMQLQAAIHVMYNKGVYYSLNSQRHPTTFATAYMRAAYVIFTDSNVPVRKILK